MHEDTLNLMPGVHLPWTGPMPRRRFLKAFGTTVALALAAPWLPSVVARPGESSVPQSRLRLTLTVNGKSESLDIEPVATLIDVLRERFQLTGTKKGCDLGQCGACTVLLDGRRVLSCLTLAALCESSKVTTIEGIGPDQLQPIQKAFLEHDGFQCGYCTSGQICSAVGVLEESRKGHASFVSVDLQHPGKLNDAEVRERMAGNLCRCGAYNGIVKAVLACQENA